MEAYTYSIIHKETKKFYYGVRKSSTEDIGIIYFSSSKLVKRLIQEQGIDAFTFKVRKRFNTYNQAKSHETKFLQRIKAVKNQQCFNQAISSPIQHGKDSESEQRRRQSVSLTMKKLWKDPIYRNNQKFIKISTKERQERGKKGGLKRAHNIRNGITIINRKKSIIKKMYKMQKNTTIKTIKPNHVPAYKACGYIIIEEIMINTN